MVKKLFNIKQLSKGLIIALVFFVGDFLFLSKEMYTSFKVAGIIFTASFIGALVRWIIYNKFRYSR